MWIVKSKVLSEKDLSNLKNFPDILLSLSGKFVSKIKNIFTKWLYRICFEKSSFS